MTMSDTQTPTAIDRIKQDLAANDVVLFMKGTPNLPQCGFSGQVAKILAHLETPYKGVNVLEDMEIREGVKQYANWPTVPQLYIKGEFVGGCDIVREMFESGELIDQLKAAGVPVRDPRI
jgi:monothiol glutaredoxin